ncbi:MAG: c-type cytochrome [Pseudomonadota bacterium]|nr:c-type cytochrome [Pseudomonadota bacterium]
MKSLSIIAGSLLLGVASCSVPERGSAERFSASGELIALSGADAGAANACFTCHGIDGLGDGAGVPRLAALDAGYLDAQLRAYADGRRYHAQMEWISSQLSERDRVEVSRYYAALPYESAQASEAAPALALYVAGDPARGVPSCASCHGLQGEGVGLGNPPLAGQPAPYLAAQLHAWRDSKRRSDPGNIMLDISQRLTPAEVTALSAYAAALPGRPHDRESRAASR